MISIASEGWKQDTLCNYGHMITILFILVDPELYQKCFYHLCISTILVIYLNHCVVVLW